MQVVWEPWTLFLERTLALIFEVERHASVRLLLLRLLPDAILLYLVLCIRAFLPSSLSPLDQRFADSFVTFDHVGRVCVPCFWRQALHVL